MHSALLMNSISLIGAETPTATASPAGTGTATSTLIGTNISLHNVETVARGTVNTTLNIVLTGSAMLIALALGLLLRKICVRRLQQTVLDNWAVQTLGILVIIPPLMIGAIVALAIWNNLFSLIHHLTVSYNIDIYSIGFNSSETLILIALSIGFARTVKKL